jgi:hypothetical protein
MTQANPPPSAAKRSWLRIPLMALSIGALTAGLWAGLLRIGWQIPPLSARLLIEHGPLMVAGFLGTLISLERAVALSQLQQGRRVYFLAPLLAGLGTVALFLPVPPFVPRLLVTLAALGFLIIFIIIYRLQPSTHNAVMSLGVLLWLLGNGLWLVGLPVFRVVPWWVGFLVLTIAGERLELARVLILTKAVRMLFFAITGMVLAGLLISLALNDFGLRITGVGLAALGLWLFRFDIARRTIRQQGLTRYIAACLLPGYAWLALGGLLWIVYGGRFPAGPIYDAMLHTIFIGFVFSMIYGHAPVIIPAVMGVPIKYLSIFYFHLGLLHISLVLRIAGDLLFLQSIRRWGGLLNEVAVILFLLVTIIAARRGTRINSRLDVIREG